MWHEKTVEAARGKWRGILMEMGLPESYLVNKHGPCPMCAGTDRFRFDDREGKGTYICGRCGAGDGMRLAMLFTGCSFQDTAGRIDEIVRNVKHDSVKPKREISDGERRSILNATWQKADKPQPGDLLHKYMGGRGIDTHDMPSDLRIAPALNDGEGGVRPAMVAMVRGPDGTPATLHRTFLRPDGSAKAEMASPRKLMPGCVPDGSAVRLGVAGDAIGISEGIETAMAASQLFELPVWAAISAAMMAKWTPPSGPSEVCIFADHDKSYAGQAAAFALAHRLSRDFDVTVKLPPNVGEDWNDVLLRRESSRKEAA